MSRSVRRRTARLLVYLLPLAAGCTPAPVEWRSSEVVNQPAPDADPGWRFAPLPARAGTRACEAPSPYVARDEIVFTTWWAVRPDSSAALLSARSDDGGRSWGAPVPVDTLDRGGRGCTRPAPALAYDPAGGYVHVVYFLEAPEGPGLFFAHSMDRGLTYHSPVAIVYGERAVEASVDADHDTVAVAYVDPNSARGRTMLAVSRTAGHIFEEKAIPVSGSDGASAAAAPRVVVRGHTVTVTWREGGGMVERVGVLREKR